jgi:hypothetical protein
VTLHAGLEDHVRDHEQENEQLETRDEEHPLDPASHVGVARAMLADEAVNADGFRSDENRPTKNENAYPARPSTIQVSSKAHGPVRASGRRGPRAAAR